MKRRWIGIPNFKTPPWVHQAKEFKISHELVSRAHLWGMRTGKSKIIIDTACHMWLAGEIEALLIMAPNGVHINWLVNEVPVHIWDNVRWVSMPWISSKAKNLSYKAQMRKFMEADGLKILAVNSETLIHSGAQECIKELLSRTKGRVLMEVDESQDFARPGSKRTKLIRGLSKKVNYRRISSGTAVLDSPLQAFSQFEILKKGALGFTTYADFKKRYAEYEIAKTRSGRNYPRLVRFLNPRELRDKLSDWSSVVLREDCDDMPELVFSDRPVGLSEAQSKAYMKLVDEWILEAGDWHLDIIEGGVRQTKLQQILSGFFIDDLGDVISIDDNPPRLQAFIREVEACAPSKFIVWCYFREDIRRVCASLEKQGISFVEYHGGVKQLDRTQAIADFQDPGGPRGFVGQSQAGSRGLNLSAADFIFNYSYTSKAAMWAQAIERGTQMGGKSVAVVTFYKPGSVDEHIKTMLREKIKRADRISGRGLRDLLLLTSLYE